MSFSLQQTDATGATAARLGTVVTAHGAFPTPMFMPVGTQGTVKGLTPDQLREMGTRILLGNTYHLEIRPGSERIRGLGGLHQFMGWHGPILTDSGGFQAFSLSELRTVTDSGVVFKSHLDGARIELTPARVLEIQQNLGSDIAMVLDVCPPADAPRDAVEEAVRRTLLWARISRSEADLRGMCANDRMVFGIVQGSRFGDLRESCARALVDLDFPGYAIGGVSVGEAEPVMLEQVAVSAACLPADKPRYVMGVGTPPQLLQMIALGADMFDCVMPSREARHGIAFTPDGKINLRNQRFRDDPAPLVEGLDNATCRQFSRAYIRHLIMAGEMLGATLLTQHNLHFFLDLMHQARTHIAAGDFGTWHRAWIERYNGAAADR
jgi:queuine tRNA-ribosyltransferase